MKCKFPTRTLGSLYRLLSSSMIPAQLPLKGLSVSEDGP
jgi:hypothetical protein